MDDTASAQRAKNSIQDEMDLANIAVSDLLNLAYIQHMVLWERMKNSNERDALLTLHYCFNDRLKALHKTCGHITEALVGTSAPGEKPAKAKRSVSSVPSVKNNIVSLD